MILIIFLLVVGIALALVILGFSIDDSALELVGLSFLFIAGSILLAGNVQYTSGEDINTSYNYLINSSDIDYLETSKTYNYSSYNDTTSHFIGVYLMIVSMLASAVIFTRLKADEN